MPGGSELVLLTFAVHVTILSENVDAGPPIVNLLNSS